MENKFNFFNLILLIVLLNSCHFPSAPDRHELYKSELFAVEREFCAMAQSEGILKAFLYFAADSSVILRGDRLLKGKEAIRLQYESLPARGVKLDWIPDFADVSSSGDLGYTFGKYTFFKTDSTGHLIRSTGIFHTVWRRQPDGHWKFVWD